MVVFSQPEWLIWARSRIIRICLVVVLGLLFGFQFSAITRFWQFRRSSAKAARRTFAAPQTVIVSDRRLPGAERSKLAKPTLQPSACVLQPETHPGVSVLLQTKDQSPIRPNGDRTVEVAFPVFGRSNLGTCQPVFASPCRPFSRGS